MLSEKEKEKLSGGEVLPYIKKSRGSFALTKKQIDVFLRELKKAERSSATIETYRQNLIAFYAFLSPDKQIDASSLPAWRDYLLEMNYSHRSVNSKISAVNSLYNYLGKRDWQITTIQKVQSEEGPELSREEYLRLLREAKRQENSKLYLIVKTLACTDLVPSDLVLLTREAVNEGVVKGKMRGTDRVVELPIYLREDLRDYAIYRGIRSGPIFLTDNGIPYVRTSITKMIGILGNDIDLEPGKATPRNLHRLYLSTLDDFQKKADVWVADSYKKLLSEEETAIGWRVWPCSGDMKETTDA